LDHSFVEALSDVPRLLRKFVVWVAILIAGTLLMLARSSPALAADSHGKSDNAKQGAATAQRHDAPSHQHDQEIGGGGGKGNGDGKDKGKTGGAAASQDAAPARGSDGGKAQTS